VRARRTDANHQEIAEAARTLGCTVLDLSRVGGGCPDLLIGVYMGRKLNLLVEVKDGSKSPSARKLTPDQERFHGDWRGQVAVVSTVSELLALLKVSGCGDSAG
jgi:hypothetical protein